MPHIVLSTSCDLAENPDSPEILNRLTQRLAQQETVKASAIKARHYVFNQWAQGEGAPAGFAHCEVAILSGRPAEVKSKIADAVFDELKKCFSDSWSRGEASITLELREMDESVYRRAHR